VLVEIDLIEVPTLRFSMGSDRLAGHPDDDEGPVREVTVGRMVVSPTPITVAQFDRFVTDTGFETVAEREGSGFRCPGILYVERTAVADRSGVGTYCPRACGGD